MQFLLPYDDLITEALENRVSISLFDEQPSILGPEFLMAIMLQTGRATDKERLIRFVKEYQFDETKLEKILGTFDLLGKYREFRQRYNG